MMTTVWIGIDVGKDRFEAAVLTYIEPEDFRKIPHKGFARNEDGVLKMLSWADDLIALRDGQDCEELKTRVVMDATGRYSLELVAWLIKAKPTVQPAMINPHQLKHYHHSLALRNKTDGVDCRSHALFGLERNPVAFKLLKKHQQDLRELGRQRAYLMKGKIAACNRYSEVKNVTYVGTQQKQIVAFFQRRIAQTTDNMRKIVNRHPEIQNDIRLLCSIPGIRELTAMLVLAEVGDFRWFESTRKISAFSGLSPRINISGKLTGKSRISRKGSPALRHALHMPAVSCIGRDNILGRKYQQLTHNGKKGKQAICAISRKILVIARAIIVNQEPYRDNYRIKQATAKPPPSPIDACEKTGANPP